MKCPYCGNEMSKGYLQSERTAFWSEQIKKFFITADVINDIELTTTAWNGTYAEALICRDCKKLIMDIK